VRHVSNRQRRRAAEEAISLGTRAHLILLAVLAQQGGEITVDQKTIDQVGLRLAEVDYDIIPGGTPGTFTIRMIGETKAHGDADA
jgi:hypothetical protein